MSATGRDATGRDATAEQLLEQATKVVEAGQGDLEGVWPRAAAAITRQALESHARVLLQSAGAKVDEVRFGALMLATQAVMHPEDARELSHLWSRLSECLHHTELGTTLDVRVAVKRAQTLIREPRPVPESEAEDEVE